MAKAKKTSAVPPSGKKKIRLWQAILAVLVLGAMISPFFLKNRDSSSAGADQSSGNFADNPPIQDRLILPALPRNPRPVTLEPAAFPDPDVCQAYQVAKDDPEPLEHMACYCGCFAQAGHRNNLDCFKDNHGAT